LVDQVREARSGYRRVYGVRKTWRQLKRMGVSDVGRARVMRQKGWQGVRRGRRVRTTRAEQAAERARDLVERRFQASRPNQLWVADFTYLRTYSGFCYLAFILEHATLSWTGFYNHERLHEQLGDVPPAEYEALHATNDTTSEHAAQTPTDRRAERAAHAPRAGGEDSTPTETGASRPPRPTGQRSHRARRPTSKHETWKPTNRASRKPGALHAGLGDARVSEYRRRYSSDWPPAVSHAAAAV
jgi:hypothetical protein